ncbi:MAG TPA: aspartate aminotransferase family protein, partial [Actinomycetota bacterium]|nr:aspartate aminotransferase family protein [Actinomycetota bacterium]
ELLEASDQFRLYQHPELDILAFWPRPGSPSCAAVDAASAALLQAAMADPSPVYLSTLRLGAARLRHRDPALAPDTAEARVLRSVLMKPEHEGYVDTLHRELVRISGNLAA